MLETKGYDSKNEIGEKEKLKIAGVIQFFKALEKKGVNVRYETKLNQDTLAGIITKGVQTQVCIPNSG